MEPTLSQRHVPPSASTPEAPLLASGNASDTDSEAWRRELASRVSRYRSRRKGAQPRYPSLQLPFDPAAPTLKTPLLEEQNVRVPDIAADEPEVEPESSQPESLIQSDSLLPQVIGQPSAKVIEFPLFAWSPPPSPPDQLAEPVIDRPLILEVPEVAPPPPALGGITIETARAEDLEKRLVIDVPLQPAPLARRLLASVIDGVILGAASAFFGIIFWKVVLVRPPQAQLLCLAAGIPCAFWAAYQYLLIVYAGSTPGLRLAGLQLSRFDGTPTKRAIRRWRVLASYLSAASLGMGYAWLFLDEDSLCWHDRITRTYIASWKDTSAN